MSKPKLFLTEFSENDRIFVNRIFYVYGNYGEGVINYFVPGDKVTLAFNRNFNLVLIRPLIRPSRQ